MTLIPEDAALVEPLYKTFERQVKALEHAQETLEQIAVQVREHETDHEKMYLPRGLPDRVAATFTRYQRQRDQALVFAQSFQDDMLLYLRALALTLEMVGNAETHKEKDARLRGVISQVESAIQKVRDHQATFNGRYWYGRPDLFRSDYPVREFMDRAHKAERRVKDLEAQLRQQPGQPEPEEAVNEIPL